MIVNFQVALGRTRGLAERSLRANRGSEIGYSTEISCRDGRHRTARHRTISFQPEIALTRRTGSPLTLATTMADPVPPFDPKG